VPSWLRFWAELLGFIRRPRISLLVPFRPQADAQQREDIWHWLRAYWHHELPDAEIVVGRNWDYPYCKTCAVNNAASRAHGDIFVILDADTYFDGKVIQRCADRIRAAQERGHRLWFIPYRHVYRLTQETSARILASFPQDPIRISSPPPPEDVESTLGSSHGHRFGAMIQIMPREAFELVGGMDERFIGWGGEDVAFVRALDTLYNPHKTTENDVLHIWHPKIGATHQDRQWAGQTGPGANDRLTSRYNQATGDRVRMRNLSEEDGAHVKAKYRFSLMKLKVKSRKAP
jgi:hypothetical protein